MKSLNNFPRKPVCNLSLPREWSNVQSNRFMWLFNLLFNKQKYLQYHSNYCTDWCPWDRDQLPDPKQTCLLYILRYTLGQPCGIIKTFKCRLKWIHLLDMDISSTGPEMHKYAPCFGINMQPYSARLQGLQLFFPGCWCIIARNHFIICAFVCVEFQRNAQQMVLFSRE